MAELILDDVRRRGPGVEVEFRLVRADRASLAVVDARLTALRRRGVSIVCRVAREPRPESIAPDAA